MKIKGKPILCVLAIQIIMREKNKQKKEKPNCKINAPCSCNEPHTAVRFLFIWKFQTSFHKTEIDSTAHCPIVAFKNMQLHGALLQWIMVGNVKGLRHDIIRLFV